MKKLPECGYIQLEELDFSATIDRGALVLRAVWEYPNARVSFGLHPEAGFDHECNYHVLFVTAPYMSQGYAKDKALAEDLLCQWGLEISANLASNHLHAYIDRKLRGKGIAVYQNILKEKLSGLTFTDNIYLEIICIFVDFYAANPALPKEKPTDAEKALLGKQQ